MARQKNDRKGAKGDSRKVSKRRREDFTGNEELAEVGFDILGNDDEIASLSGSDDSEMDDVLAREEQRQRKRRLGQADEEDKKAKAEKQKEAVKLPVKTPDGNVADAKSLEEQTWLEQPEKTTLSLVWQPGEREAIESAKSKDLKKSKKDIEKEKAEEAEAARKKSRKERMDEERNKINEEINSFKQLNAAGLMLRREEKKQEIAIYGQKVLGDPESGVNGKVAGGAPIKHLLDMAERDPDTRVRKLSLLSLVAVFRDILPGYRIREASAAETNVKQKKEVRKLRDFERNTLQSYQAFLKIVHSEISGKLGPSSELFADLKTTKHDLLEDVETRGAGKLPKSCAVALVAVRAQCTMLVSKPHFNFRENLLTNVIPQLNNRFADVRAQAVACISTLLADDVTGDATLEIVTFISKFVRLRNNGDKGGVHPDVIDVLQHCVINSDMKDDVRAEKVKKSKKKRKLSRRRNDEVALGLAQAEAQSDETHRFAKSVEALRELFTMYLRVLKYAPESSLMQSILRGVSKYVHLINLDIAQALMTVLLNLIKADNIPLGVGLQVVHTISLTLRGPGHEIQSDESEVVAYFYRLLLKLATSEPDRDRHVGLVVSCVDSLFLGRKLYQQSRVAALATRLSIVATTMPPHACLALIATVRMLTMRYASVCRSLFDADADQIEGANSLALGVIPSPLDATANVDPGLTRLDTPAFWPLAQLRFHYHPQVRTMATKALQREPVLPNERAMQQYKAFNPSRNGFSFNPPVPRAPQLTMGKKQKRN
mmetsp:Transcript_22447/g.44082  ORF Transcript_22447/g.44082 Transcript_22447/m.44082 type:complete len:772 (+) Transcript_22447:192-2507(+)